MAKYKKIVELPTGVTTRIDTSLEGTVQIDCMVLPLFNNPIPKNEYKVEWWELVNGGEDWECFDDTVIAESMKEASDKILGRNPLARTIKITK